MLNFFKNIINRIFNWQRKDTISSLNSLILCLNDLHIKNNLLNYIILIIYLYVYFCYIYIFHGLLYNKEFVDLGENLLRNKMILIILLSHIMIISFMFILGKLINIFFIKQLLKRHLWLLKYKTWYLKVLYWFEQRIIEKILLKFLRIIMQVRYNKKYITKNKVTTDYRNMCKILKECLYKFTSYFMFFIYLMLCICEIILSKSINYLPYCFYLVAFSYIYSQTRLFYNSADRKKDMLIIEYLYGTYEKTEANIKEKHHILYQNYNDINLYIINNLYKKTFKRTFTKVCNKTCIIIYMLLFTSIIGFYIITTQEYLIMLNVFNIQLQLYKVSLLTPLYGMCYLLYNIYIKNDRNSYYLFLILFIIQNIIFIMTQKASFYQESEIINIDGFILIIKILTLKEKIDFIHKEIKKYLEENSITREIYNIILEKLSKTNLNDLLKEYKTYKDLRHFLTYLVFHTKLKKLLSIYIKMKFDMTSIKKFLNIRSRKWWLRLLHKYADLYCKMWVIQTLLLGFLRHGIRIGILALCKYVPGFEWLFVTCIRLYILDISRNRIESTGNISYKLYQWILVLYGDGTWFNRNK